MGKTISTFTLLLVFVSVFAQKPYKGGEIYSREKVLYGKFEMRMKMIKGSGMLSTFYTIRQGDGNNSSYWSELDIEVLGRNNAQIMSTNIFINGSNGSLNYSEEQIPLDYSLADNYHVFTLEWTPIYVAWYIDGLLVRKKTGAFVNHMKNVSQGYRFNAWISNTPAWVGNIDESAMPANQYIDWLEYSSYNPSTQDFTKQWRDDFNSFDNSRWSKAQWTFGGNQVDFVPQNVTIEDGKLVLAITNPNAVLSTDDKIISTSISVKYFKKNKEIVINGIEKSDYKIHLYDLTGKVLFSKEFNSSNFTIPCSNIKSGLYIISIINNGKSFRQKLVVN